MCQGLSFHDPLFLNYYGNIPDAPHQGRLRIMAPILADFSEDHSAFFFFWQFYFFIFFWF